ncbi:hypothetical protein MPH_12130 [Macrophomina phaseolina MS6]|uniref:Uncharacterized protein n=1 Tax=Macrophomina phaseolina (strain MS6) TaxID=1126212 RepID=K2RCV9_MACPH|nr:hypothetical protein MPH_12130 [Macrophomina phaseolina MS6]
MGVRQPRLRFTPAAGTDIIVRDRAHLQAWPCFLSLSSSSSVALSPECCPWSALFAIPGRLSALYS